MEKKAFLRQAYTDYVLEKGKRPTSVHQFVKTLDGTDEAEFYQNYNSLLLLEKDFWRQFMTETLDRLRGDENYLNYSAREKLLAFYFTWIEVLKANRSYVLFMAGQMRRGKASPRQLEGFRQDFIAYIDELVQEGQDTDEIAQRPFLTDFYGRALYAQALFVLRAFVRDETENFEGTDAAIEKAVNFTFDLIGRNALDSGFDFFKFVFQNRRMTF